MTKIITPDEYYQATCKLADILRKEYVPDLIVPIGGGMNPAAILQEELRVKARSIDVGRDGDRRIITYDLNLDVDGKKLLLLEDIVPTERGASLRMAKEAFIGRGAEVRMAAPVVGERTPVDYFGLQLNEDFRVYWKVTR